MDHAYGKGALVRVGTTDQPDVPVLEQVTTDSSLQPFEDGMAGSAPIGFFRGVENYLGLVGRAGSVVQEAPTGWPQKRGGSRRGTPKINGTSEETEDGDSTLIACGWVM